MRFIISLAILISTAYCADFTTYVGPLAVNESAGVAAIATDSAGNTYVTGSNTFFTYVTGIQAFVAKLDPAGNIVFTVPLGGTCDTGGPGCTYPDAIAVDPAGNIWVGGQNLGIPLVNPLQSVQVVYEQGFLVKLAPNGTVLYASYFGGGLGSSGVNGVATDQSGNVYVTGWTEASDFPTTPGLPASSVTGGSAPVAGLFVSKLDPTGQKILYSTVIAGPANCSFCFPVPDTMGIGIAVDGSGDALVAGDTDTSDLPVTAQGIVAPGAFALKINADGNALGYFTYLGSGATVGNFSSPATAAAAPIAADSSGNAYVAAYYSGIQGFVTKLSPDGTTAWVTSLSALNPSAPNAISVDSSDNAWLTGGEGTPSVPGGSFVTELSADGSAFPYSQQFPAEVAGQALAVDQSGVLHVTGYLGLVSTITPAQPPAPRVLSIVNAASNELTGLVAPGEIISLYGTGLGPTTPAPATPENGLFPTSLGGVQVSVNGSSIPLLYVSATQINAEIPFDGNRLGTVVNATSVVQVMNNSTPLPDFTLGNVSADFAVFGNAGGSMTVINQDGTLNKIANPAKVGSVVSIWATGFGIAGAPVVGAVPTAANNYCSSCQVTLTNNEGTTYTETVQYAGTSPGLIDGLMQINFVVPQPSNGNAGLWVYFTPPGYTYPIQLGWVNISQ
jgi:uncharacterized protein (TIGR03437 family)